MGQSTAQTAGSVVGGGLIQAAPFVAATGAVIGMISNLFKFGYDPSKLGGYRAHRGCPGQDEPGLVRLERRGAERS